ncbi:hypothetical protein QEH42_gp224 [Microbacterium phage Pumpernickel]|uniref:Uncharacterized protein n=1 Tax=Microbacterium phage Pumpernickel TaxID=2885983 RepID=A0AAE9C3K1_9CAUD|nr:hypothetical protein QEH42_gp224 [Microbacterium phage Pumpernickel]UDL15994.1 hypothetical protein SEA_PUMPERNICKEL_244 [Microbacterium phage Pumpernickel]
MTGETLRSGDIIAVSKVDRDEKFTGRVEYSTEGPYIMFAGKRFEIDYLIRDGYEISVEEPFPHPLPTKPGLYRTAPNERRSRHDSHYVFLYSIEKNGETRLYWSHMGSGVHEWHNSLHYSYFPLEFIE